MCPAPARKSSARLPQNDVLSRPRPRRAATLGLVTDSWKAFAQQMQTLEGALGDGGIELLRVFPGDLSQLEKELGVTGLIEHLDRFTRLVAELLPPHFPVLKLPTGDLIIAVDTMMSSFFTKQILDEVPHLRRNAKSFAVAIKKGTPKSREELSLEDILACVQV